MMNRNRFIMKKKLNKLIVLGTILNIKIYLIYQY